MNFKKILIVWTIILIALQSGVALAKSGKRVLMVISGYGQQKTDQKQQRPGYEFDEFAQAYLIFKQNKIEVDVASPQGGKVEADQYNSEKPFNKLVLEDSSIMAKLHYSKSMKELDSTDYDGVFIVGGKGAMFDLPKDQPLQKVVAEIYENHGIVAAVCHGPAALTDIKLSNGQYLVSGKKINGFTNKEEKMFGKKWIKQFDFMLEDRLIERGGKFQKSDILLSHVAIDGRLLTGQNPASTPKVAEALVRSMGINPAKRTIFKEERSFDFIADVWNGNSPTEAVFDQQLHDPKYVAMYGFYRLKHASNDDERSKSVALLEMAQPYYQHPMVAMTLAEGYQALGKIEKAKDTLVALLKSHPDMDQAKQMLTKL